MRNTAKSVAASVAVVILFLVGFPTDSRASLIEPAIALSSAPLASFEPAAVTLANATPASSLTAATMLANAIPAWNNPAIDRFFASPSRASVPIILIACNREPDPQACKDAVNAVFDNDDSDPMWRCYGKQGFMKKSEYDSAKCGCQKGTRKVKSANIGGKTVPACECSNVPGVYVKYNEDVGETCVAQTCGNGVIEGNEVCDDGNTEDGDWCSSDCTEDTIPTWLIVLLALAGAGLAGFLFWFFYWRKRVRVNCPKDPMHPKGKPGDKCKCGETYPEPPKTDTSSGPSGDSSASTPDADTAEDSSSQASAAAVTSAVAAGAALATPATVAAPEGEAAVPSDPVALTKAILGNDEARNMLAEQVLLQVGEKVQNAIGESRLDELREMTSNAEDSILELQAKLKAAQENGDPIAEAGCEAAIQSLDGHRKKLQERYDHVTEINSTPPDGGPDQGPPPPPIPEGDSQ